MENFRGKSRRYFLSHLGCSKNRVDGDIICALLDKSGWISSEKPEGSDVIIVNTCGFIEDAKEESIDAILEACEFKESNPGIKIAVTGCMGQRYFEDLAREIPEIDHIIGLNRIKDISNILNGTSGKKIDVEENRAIFNDDLINRAQSHDKAYAYLRISDGCSNHCSYCAIPLIRGEFRSRLPEKIVEEAKHLIQNGVKEIIIISQDTTRYGDDLKEHVNLTFLLRSLCTIEGDFWIRLLYCHPAHFTRDLIYIISDEDKILNYIDLPIQHCSNNILLSMGRNYTKDHIRNLIGELRTKLKDVVLRTTVIAGYPGETDKEFEELWEFLEEIEFNHLGAFKFSAEEGTRASKIDKPVSPDVMDERLEKIMLLQADISREKNSEFSGKTFKSLIEKNKESGEPEYIGRCYAHAPEVDGNIFIENLSARIDLNRFYDVKITGSDVYDLYGEMIT